MRKINTHDTFTLMRLIKKTGLKDKLKGIAEKASKGDLNQFDAGYDLIVDLFISVGDTEEDLLSFMSGPLEVSAEELKEKDLIEMVELLKDLVEFHSSDDWKAFFSSLRLLME